ncbi:hypothetical protein GCM10012279_59200 [Micromonospora yangpuensis]|nr:hypothetical protein GCM10012279_59200 [Micromonospora yangpuensis]
MGLDLRGVDLRRTELFLDPVPSRGARRPGGSTSTDHSQEVRGYLCCGTGLRPDADPVPVPEKHHGHVEYDKQGKGPTDRGVTNV